MKVCMWPTPNEIPMNHGIGRIVHAQWKYLPQLGIEFVDEDQADIIVAHTQQFDLHDIDVLMVHGCYWTGDPGSGVYEKWHHHANFKIIEAARRARIITVPSEWVAEPFKRDMRVTPTVIGHGLDFDQWEPAKEFYNYVLWNKNRNSDVCDPTPALLMAKRGARVVSTFGPLGQELPETMQTIGTVDHERMRLLVQKAAVYLATVKETYGIGTLEAMACGVPVLGYRHGGTADLIEHKVTGYLVEPGDIDGLMEGLAYIQAHRSQLGANAREFARTRDWPLVIGQYADVYQAALDSKHLDSTKVSVVITNHNYREYVGEAIQSVLDQTIPCEIVVVDDGSTDHSDDFILDLAKKFPDRVRPIIQANQGVAAARNNGIRAAQGEFIVCLDADDNLDVSYAQVLRDALMGDRGLGVAYAGLGLIGRQGLMPNNWPPAFDWDVQSEPHNPPQNCVPCAAMFRKSMWVRAGGYRQEYAPGEDTEFFTRGLSVGFTASKVTDDYLFHYRSHDGSASHTKKYIPIDQWLPWMKDKKFPMAVPIYRGVPVVRSYSMPKVSVIIPVGPGHEQYLPKALDSLLGQTMREWEVIVVLDSAGTPLPDSLLETYPFIRSFASGMKNGSSACRNIGLAQAKAPLVLFLDADDWLMPAALASMCAAYANGEGRYVYTDWLAVMSGKVQQESVPEYDSKAILYAPQHAVTVLMATDDARKIKFDEQMPILEEWDFFARCAIAGYHGLRIPLPLVAVRVHSNRKTDKWGAASQTDKDTLLKSITDRYAEYREGGKPMGSCCGGNGAAVVAAKMAAGLDMSPMQVMEDFMQPAEQASVARMQYIGDRVGAVSYGGPNITPTGARYRGGNNPMDRYLNADPKDVAWLEGTGVWRRIQPPAKIAPPIDAPAVDQVMELLQRESANDAPVTLPPQESIPVSQPMSDFKMPLRVSDLEGAQAESDPETGMSFEPQTAPPPPADGGMLLPDRPRRGRPPKARQDMP